MSTGPGRVMRVVQRQLVKHGAVSYTELCRAAYGDAFTEAERNSLAAAIRRLARRGEVEIYTEHMSMFVDGQWREAGQWVRRVDRAVA